MPTGTVVITVTKQGSAYQVKVAPWLVKPPGSTALTRIEWTFNPVGTTFTDFKLDFATKDHFVDARNISPSPTPHYVLDNHPNPVPPDGGVLGSDIKTPGSKNLNEYEYIIEFALTGGPKIEIDPGYRVRP